MPRTTVALIDTNFSSLPIYDYLLQMEYKVFVVGNNPNDYLAKISHNYINIDYKDTSLLARFLIKNNINFIVPGCNDVSYNSCSLVKEYKQYIGIENKVVTDTINKKNKFKDFCLQNNIPTPRKILPSQLRKNLPAMFKPTNSFSGRGIYKISTSNFKNRKKIESEAKKYSSEKKILIEEFLSGQLYSHSAFIRDKRITYDFFVEEHCITNPYAVDTSTIAFNIPEEVKNRVRRDIEKIVEKLSLIDGLIHSQFIFRKDDYSIIESTRRCPGDLYALLIKKATGFPYSEYYTNTYINRQSKGYKKKVADKFVLRHTISSTKSVSLKYLKFKESIPINELYFFEICGSITKSSLNGRIGVVFFILESLEELKRIINKIKRRELYEFY